LLTTPILFSISLEQYPVIPTSRNTGVWCFSLAGCQVPTEATLSLPLLTWTGEKKHKKRLLGPDKDRQKSLINYRNRQNRLELGKLI